MFIVLILDSGFPWSRKIEPQPQTLKFRVEAAFRSSLDPEFRNPLCSSLGFDQSKAWDLLKRVPLIEESHSVLVSTSLPLSVLFSPVGLWNHRIFKSPEFSSKLSFVISAPLSLNSPAWEGIKFNRRVFITASLKVRLKKIWPDLVRNVRLQLPQHSEAFCRSLTRSVSFFKPNDY